MAIKKSAARTRKPIAPPASTDQISQSILILRGHKVLLDSDLAMLYGVETKVLLQCVRRNLARFPDDFMLQLTADEWRALRSQIATSTDDNLRSQIVTSSLSHGGRRYAPYAFTEQGVAMLSSVLKSERAIAMNIEIMRAFVRMRNLLASNQELSRQLKALEDRAARKFAAHDHAIADIIKTIRQLMTQPVKKSRPIGFTANLYVE